MQKVDLSHFKLENLTGLLKSSLPETSAVERKVLLISGKIYRRQHTRTFRIISLGTFNIYIHQTNINSDKKQTTLTGVDIFQRNTLFRLTLNLCLSIHGTDFSVRC